MNSHGNPRITVEVKDHGDSFVQTVKYQVGSDDHVTTVVLDLSSATSLRDQLSELIGSRSRVGKKAAVTRRYRVEKPHGRNSGVEYVEAESEASAFRRSKFFGTCHVLEVRIFPMPRGDL